MSMLTSKPFAILMVCLTVSQSIVGADLAQPLFDGTYVTVTNSSLSIQYFVLVRSRFALGSRHEKMYDKADLNHLKIYCLLPGDSVKVPQYKRSVTLYDRDIIVTKVPQYSTLQRVVLSGNFKDAGVGVFNVGAASSVYIGADNKFNLKFFTSESAATSNLSRYSRSYGSLLDLQKAAQAQFKMDRSPSPQPPKGSKDPLGDRRVKTLPTR